MVIAIDLNNRVIGYAFLDDLVCHTEKGQFSKKDSILREIPDFDRDSQEYKYFAEHYRECVYIPTEKRIKYV